MKNFTFTKNSELVGKYVNRYFYTDVRPLGKIVGTRGKTILILERVTAELDESFKADIQNGGFAGHCSNNHSQKYNYTVLTDDTFEIRWTPGKLRKDQLRIADRPVEFYDYNF